MVKPTARSATCVLLDVEVGGPARALGSHQELRLHRNESIAFADLVAAVPVQLVLDDRPNGASLQL